jgi:hypothetical protein
VGPADAWLQDPQQQAHAEDDPEGSENEVIADFRF